MFYLFIMYMIEKKKQSLWPNELYHKKITARAHQQHMWNLWSLSALRTKLNKDVLETKEKVIGRREDLWYIEINKYPLEQLKQSITKHVLDMWYEDIDSWDIWISFIDRKKLWKDGERLWSDIAIKVSPLIGSLWKEYREDFIPKLKSRLLESTDLSKNITEIQEKGIYINLTLDDGYLFSLLNSVQEFGWLYGHTDQYKDQHVVIDYSSPNTAKRLHAWHIRSTVLGHVLWNIYEANWYTVHRMNHVNDWGWFWVFIAWMQHWKEYYAANNIHENEMMVHIYTTHRLAQKVSKDKETFNDMSVFDKEILEWTIWWTDTYEAFKDRFQLFEVESKKAFSNLETWKEKEVEDWQKIVNWSLDEFQHFYNELDIHLDYVVWESHYADKWKQLVLKWVESWEMVYYDEWFANRTISDINHDQSLTKKFAQQMIESAQNDIWSYVVQLPKYERYVVMKSDWSTIYATRDLWAVTYRMQTFDPVIIDYVVWQEQDEHFQKLFDSTKQLDYEKISSHDSVALNHIPFWFYVNAETKKKLSSREWAANVHKLIQESKQYYANKYKDSEFDDEEIIDIAQKLAIWWIVYNDISKTRKQDVLIHEDLQKTIQGFESSWWVYIVYAICRAKSALHKFEENFWQWYKAFDSITIQWALSDEVIALIKKIQSCTNEIKKAADKKEPSILAQYLFEMAQAFNSFYANNSLIRWWEKAEMRAWITMQAIQTMQNICKICHIQVPDRI